VAKGGGTLWTREQLLELIDELGGMLAMSKKDFAKAMAERARACMKDNWFAPTKEHWPDGYLERHSDE
jgi:hypothetical protein